MTTLHSWDDHAHLPPGSAPGIATPIRHKSGPARYCAWPPAVLATCSRAGARLHYFPRELWVVPSAEAPLGLAATGPGGTREPLNPGQQPRQRARGGLGAGTRERRARPSAGSRPDVSNRRPSGGAGPSRPWAPLLRGAFGGARTPGAVPSSPEAPAWVSQTRSRTVGCTRMACFPRPPTSSPKAALRIRSGTLNCQTCLLDKYFLAASGRVGAPKAMALNPCSR